jgi:hypothetical protein
MFSFTIVWRSIFMAINLQLSTHMPQSVHLSKSITAFLFTSFMAPSGQASIQMPQPTHLSKIIFMFAMFSVSG